MNIRDHHSRNTYHRSVDREYRPNSADGRERGPDFGSIATGGRAKEFSETLAALVGSGTKPLAEVMTAIAGELHDAADSSTGAQSRLLEALADRFETATPSPVSDEESAPTTVVVQDDAMTAVALATDSSTTDPDVDVAHAQHGLGAPPGLLGMHGHAGFLGPRQTAELISKILDAVNDAIAKVTLSSTMPDESDATTTVAVPAKDPDEILGVEGSTESFAP